MKMNSVVHFEIPPEDKARAEMGFYAYFKDSEGNIMGLWEDIKK